MSKKSDNLYNSGEYCQFNTFAIFVLTSWVTDGSIFLAPIKTKNTIEKQLIQFSKQVRTEH